MGLMDALWWVLPAVAFAGLIASGLFEIAMSLDLIAEHLSRIHDIEARLADILHRLEEMHADR